MLYVIKKENLIENWLQELSFGNSITLKVKAVHWRPTIVVHEPSFI